MSTKVNIVLRREKATGNTILFYVNSYADGRCWWIDAYSRVDGHFQANRGYVHRQTEPLKTRSLAGMALVKEWATLGKETYDCAIVGRLVGPRGLPYGGN